MVRISISAVSGMVRLSRQSVNGPGTPDVGDCHAAGDDAARNDTVNDASFWDPLRGRLTSAQALDAAAGGELEVRVLALLEGFLERGEGADISQVSQEPRRDAGSGRVAGEDLLLERRDGDRAHVFDGAGGE